MALEIHQGSKGLWHLIIAGKYGVEQGGWSKKGSRLREVVEEVRQHP